MGDHSDYLCVPPAGACGIERPHGEWLVLMCSADVRLEPLPAESRVYMGNGWFGYAVMLWVITVTTYVCLQQVLVVESSVHMGNDWFWRAVLPLTSVPSGCFWNRASTWGMANSCVTTYVSTGCLCNRALSLRMANFVTASFSGCSASPLVHMLVLSKTVSVTLFGAREALILLLLVLSGCLCHAASTWGMAGYPAL